MKNMLFVATGAILGLLAVVTCAMGRPAALPEAQAQAMAAANGEVGPVMMGMGGAQQNQNDLCWILFRDKARERKNPAPNRPVPDPYRYSLCLYRAINNGQAFDLVDVREVSYDFKVVQLNVPGHNPRLTPQAILNFYEEGLRKEAEREKEREKENTGKKGDNP